MDLTSLRINIRPNKFGSVINARVTAEINQMSEVSTIVALKNPST